MSSLTVWRMPEPAIRKIDHLVVRGSKGCCYSLPDLPRAWPKLVELGYLPDRLRWEPGTAPTQKPLPADEAERVAHHLALPGYEGVEIDPRALASEAEAVAAGLAALDAEVPHVPARWEHKRPKVTASEVLRRFGLEVEGV